MVAIARFAAASLLVLALVLAAGFTAPRAQAAAEPAVAATNSTTTSAATTTATATAWVTQRPTATSVTDTPAVRPPRPSMPITSSMPTPPDMPPVRPSRPTTPTPTDFAPARFEATVFQVEIPKDRIVDLDAGALQAKAATAQDFAKALAELGKAKIITKIDQTVNLYGDSINAASRVPFVTTTHVDAASGAKINTVQYQAVGTLFNLSATPPAKGAEAKDLIVRLSTEISDVADSDVEISPGVKAPVVQSVNFSQSGPIHYARPIVTVNLGHTSSDKSTPIAYVVRYVFSEIKP